MCKAVETVMVLCFVVNLVLKNTQHYFQLLENPSKMLQAAAFSSVLSKHLGFVSLMLNHQNVELPSFPFPFLLPSLFLCPSPCSCPLTTFWSIQFLRGGAAPEPFPNSQVSEMVKCLMYLIICLNTEFDLPSSDKYFSQKEKKRDRRGHAWSFNFVCLLIAQSFSVLIAAPVRLQ